MDHRLLQQRQLSKTVMQPSKLVTVPTRIVQPDTSKLCIINCGTNVLLNVLFVMVERSIAMPRHAKSFSKNIRRLLLVQSKILMRIVVVLSVNGK